MGPIVTFTRSPGCTSLAGFTDCSLTSTLPNIALAWSETLSTTASASLAATIAWQATPQLSIGGGAYGASRRYADPANLISAGGYLRFDAHAQYQISDHFSVRVNLNNVTDERYFVKLRNPHFAVPADGRQALVTLVALARLLPHIAVVADCPYSCPPGQPGTSIVLYPPSATPGAGSESTTKPLWVVSSCSRR